jgi:hypothetical protein
VGSTAPFAKPRIFGPRDLLLRVEFDHPRLDDDPTGPEANAAFAPALPVVFPRRANDFRATSIRVIPVMAVG